jgi:hypothetical protein
MLADCGSTLKLKSVLDVDREMINSVFDNNNRSFQVFTLRCVVKKISLKVVEIHTA